MVDPERTASLMTPAKLAQMGRPKTAPASPSAWLDQMAADAGHQHLARLAELQGVLQTHARARDHAGMRPGLEALVAQLPKLDFELLRPKGWLARATGKSRSSGAEFTAQFEAVDARARELLTQAQSLHQRAPGEGSATERTLLEIEVESRALDKIVEQGGRWLQDMQNQAKARRDTAADEQAQRQAREDAARCDILAKRLQMLREVCMLSQQTSTHAKAAADRHGALLQTLQKGVLSDVKVWQSRLSALAAGAAAGDTASSEGLEGALEVHQELRQRLSKAIAEIDAVQALEDTLAATLNDLGRQLQALR